MNIELPSYDSISVSKADVNVETVAPHERPALLKEAVISALMEACEVPLPEFAVSRRVDLMIANFRTQLAAVGMEFEEYLFQAGKSEDTLREQLRRMARETAKKEIVLRRVAQHERIIVTNEELDARIEEIAALSGMTPVEMRTTLESAGRLPVLLQEILFEKVGEFLVYRCLVE